MRTRCLVLTLGAAVLAAPALAQDSDTDGVPDAADAFPCDPSLAGVSFAPAEGAFGSVAFEDEWPNAYADLDFNDAFVAYHFEYRHAPAGGVRSVRAVLHALALGATYDNGLGLHLEAPTGAVSRVTRTIGAVTTDLLPSGADGELTVVVFDDLRALFQGRSGAINAIDADAVSTAAPIVVEVTFSRPVSLAPAQAPHDLFLFRSARPSHEIHRPGYGGTARMDPSLFGSGIDGSGGGRNFVDNYGMPYVLVFPTVVEYPKEGVDIDLLYPDIAGFAASAGQSNVDFYVSTVNLAFGYAPVTGAAPTATYVPGPSADTACVPTGGPSCLAILQSGGSTGDGVYELDLDGSGPLPPFDAYCDMTTDGGGWTLVEVLRRAYHSTTAAVNATQLTARNTHSKLADDDIRTLATNGTLQAMLRRTSTIYIQRYSAGEWASFSSRGWRNVSWDSLRANGTWANNTCNGHYNNRGFSSYSDRNGRACPVVYSGGAAYLPTWHTYNYSGGTGGDWEVYVR